MIDYSILFGQNILPSEPTFRFLQDAFTMGSKSKNNMGRILLQDSVKRFIKSLGVAGEKI